jgi:hypothetical protein
MSSSRISFLVSAFATSLTISSATVAGCGAPMAEDEEFDSTQAELSSTASAKLQGKLFGYIFGDGNYAPHKAAPRHAEFQHPLGTVAHDFVLAACKLGYNGKILSTKEPEGKQRIDCSKFTASTPLTKGSKKYTFVVENFSWPSGGDFKKYVETASGASLIGFMSGLLPTEGTRGGLILDQFPDSTYNAAQIDGKLKSIVTALRRLGFSTAQTEDRGRACTSGCNMVYIDADTEGCKFSPSAGYEFANYSRVPGAYDCTGSVTCQPPKKCQ